MTHGGLLPSSLEANQVGVTHGGHDASGNHMHDVLPFGRVGKEDLEAELSTENRMSAQKLQQTAGNCRKQQIVAYPVRSVPQVHCPS